MKSLGERRARIEFNPSKNTTVDLIKQKSAELINLLEQLPIFADTSMAIGQELLEIVERNKERQRLVEASQLYYEMAMMLAVKSVT